MPKENLVELADQKDVGSFIRDPEELAAARETLAFREYFPPPPAGVLDAGGGPDRCAVALSRWGYEVVLFDLHPLGGQARARLDRGTSGALEAPFTGTWRWKHSPGPGSG